MSDSMLVVTPETNEVTSEISGSDAAETKIGATKKSATEKIPRLSEIRLTLLEELCSLFDCIEKYVHIIYEKEVL